MYYMIYPIACGIIRAIIIASTHLAFVIYVYSRSQNNSRHRQELITYQSLLTELGTGYPIYAYGTIRVWANICIFFCLRETTSV